MLESQCHGVAQNVDRSIGYLVDHGVGVSRRSRGNWAVDSHTDRGGYLPGADHCLDAIEPSGYGLIHLLGRSDWPLSLVDKNAGVPWRAMRGPCRVPRSHGRPRYGLFIVDSKIHRR